MSALTSTLPPASRRFQIVAALVVAAVSVGIGTAIALAPELALGGTLAAGLIIAIAAHPPLGPYLIIGITPLLAGIGRDEVIPFLRPYEAVALLAGAGLGLRMIAAPLSIRLERIDVAIIVLAFCGSVLPLLLMRIRERDITADDVLYALQLWKYVGVFFIVRFSLREPKHVGTALKVALAAACIVAVIAMLQALQIGGIDAILAERFVAKDEEGYTSTNRGATTLGSSIATGDVMIFSLAIAIAWLMRGARPQPLLAGIALLLVFGTLASGQFSAVLGMVVGIAALGWVTRQFGRIALALAPLLLPAAWLLEPVIDERLKYFGGAVTWLPQSWQGRLDNLTTYFWPQLFDGINWITGVRPSARVKAPEWWREWIWIESGYTWLLWTGGVAFLLAFIGLLWIAIPRVARIARERTDAVGVAATASFTSLCVLAVLMATDPHLTLRGSADLSLSLLAMSLVPAAAAAREPRERAPRA